MTYEERKALLGLTVATQLDTGFRDDVVADKYAPHTNYRAVRIGKRVRPFELTDLSALNGQRWQNSQHSGRKGGQLAHKSNAPHQPPPGKERKPR